MPVTARRTFSMVNSSAIIARHPEVPNLICVAMATSCPKQMYDYMDVIDVRGAIRQFERVFGPMRSIPPCLVCYCLDLRSVQKTKIVKQWQRRSWSSAPQAHVKKHCVSHML